MHLAILQSNSKRNISLFLSHCLNKFYEMKKVNIFLFIYT